MRTYYSSRNSLKLLSFIAGLALVAAPPAHADMVQTLEWNDLIPAAGLDQGITGLSTPKEVPAIDHSGTAPQPIASSESAPVNIALNGKLVKIAGFIVPLEGHDNKVTAFLLVPYFGACIHVPPPPANQIVFVEYREGIDADTIYDPIWVTGPIQAGLVSTEMAETGYSIIATNITPYEIPDDDSVVTDDESVIK